MPGSGILGMVKGNEIEDEPRCEADADGRHRYRDVSRREDRGMLCVTEQCHECRMVRETACGMRRSCAGGFTIRDGECRSARDRAVRRGGICGTRQTYVEAMRWMAR